MKHTVIKISLLLCTTFLRFVIPAKLWVTIQQDKFFIKETEPFDYIAVGSYNNTINQTGWSTLDLQTRSGLNRKYKDVQQAYAAGFLEGHLTRDLMAMHWINTMANVCTEPLSYKCKQMKIFMERNVKYLKQKIKSYADKNPYWHQVELFLLQISGLQDGYSNYPGSLNTYIDVMGVYMWQVAGDMDDVRELFESVSERKPRQTFMGMGTHCSALLRLLLGNTDLYVAQESWNDLSTMLRVLKKYTHDFHFLESSNEVIPGKTTTFSSYPGMVYSSDDFYTISSGLVTQETTIGNANKKLLKYITPYSVLESFRNVVANKLATDGLEWSKIFSKHNSGTYNNQWMIVDYKKFKPGKSKPVPGIFYMLEQIPGSIEYHDLTKLLYKQTYFGSYNIAYYPGIFNKSGMPPLVKKFGNWFTYDKHPRALIFKRDVPGVIDLKSMTKLMRYNNFKHDPLSRCNCTPPYSAENAVANRDDLNPINGTYPFSLLAHIPEVAIDMKLTSYRMFQSLSFLAISSPTYDDLPPFQWSTSDYRHTKSHVGHPDLWKFPVITFNGTNTQSTN